MAHAQSSVHPVLCSKDHRTLSHVTALTLFCNEGSVVFFYRLVCVNFICAIMDSPGDEFKATKVSV